MDMPHNAVMGAEFIDPTERQRSREYEKFLESKQVVPIVSGLTDVPALHPQMFHFERDVTQWALRLGRSLV